MALVSSRSRRLAPLRAADRLTVTERARCVCRNHRGSPQSTGVCDMMYGATNLPKSVEVLKRIGAWIGPLA